MEGNHRRLRHHYEPYSEPSQQEPNRDGRGTGPRNNVGPYLIGKELDSKLNYYNFRPKLTNDNFSVNVSELLIVLKDLVDKVDNAQCTPQKEK